MKKGISIWSFAGTDVRENLKLAKEAGFDGVELALDMEGEVSMQSTKEQILEIKKFGEDLGLEFYSLACGLYWTYNYTSANEENRNKAKEITRKQIFSNFPHKSLIYKVLQLQYPEQPFSTVFISNKFGGQNKLFLSPVLSKYAIYRMRKICYQLTSFY